MKSLDTLPEGYTEIYSIDLQKNKKTAFFVNLLATVIMVVLAVPVFFFIPITATFNMNDGYVNYIIKFLILMALIVLYMVLHELVHGVAMKLCGTKKVKYGFTGLYAFAGSNDYYSKKPYIFIALAPVLFWGLVLAVITPFVSPSWFWVVYAVQIMNLSGAAGDMFVTVKFARMPKDILIKDYGVGMTVFSKL